MRSIFKVLLALSPFLYCTIRYSPLPPETRGGLSHDRNISSAAEKCAEELLKRKAHSLDKETVDFFLENADVYDVYSASVFAVSSPSEAGDEITDPRHVREFTERGFTHMGMGSAAGKDTEAFCLIVTKRELILDHLPSRVIPGRTITVAGERTGNARPSEVILLSPSGTVVKGRAVVRGNHFTSYLRLPREKGRLTMEVIVEDEWGPRPGVLAHIYSGVPPPTSPPAVSSVPAEDSLDEALSLSPRHAEEEMVHLINRDRSASGLSPLKEMPELGRVAREHSRTMKDRKRISHVVPGEGGPDDRVKAAKIPHSKILENVALARTVESAEKSLMESPGHRLNILDPSVTQVGVGVVPDDGPSGRDLYITQNFITSIVRRTSAEAGREILAIINKGRTERGLKALREDKGLGAIAGDHSDMMLKKGELFVTGVLDRVKNEGIQYSQVKILVFQTAKLEDVRMAGIKEKEAGSIGIGATQDRDGMYWITLILLTSQRRRS